MDEASGMKNIQTLVCTRIEAERMVALFTLEGQESEVFAYLPHVPGINPYLLRVGDAVEGFVVEKHGRLELMLVNQTPAREDGERRSKMRSEACSEERICHPYPRG